MDGVGDIIGNVGTVPVQITEDDTPPPQLTTDDGASDQITADDNADDDDVGIGLDETDLPVDHVIDSSTLPVEPVTIPTVTIPTTISAGDEPEVIGLLLQTQGADQDLASDITSQQLNAAVSLNQSTMVTDTGHTVQAVTLADGTTAFIQHPKGGKFLEGQTITLEDGSTAVVQGVTQVSNLPISTSLPNVTDTNTVMSHDSQLTADGQNMDGGQPVQLEDGTTAFLHHTPKEGLQAIQLEDGTTAYITHPTTDNLFGDAANCSLESTSLSLEQLTGQVATEVKAENGVDLVKTLSGAAAPITVIAAGLGSEKIFSIGEKAFKCSFEGCGRLYTTHHHLKVHERSHTGDRPFKCDFLGCNKAFATGYGLKSHTRVHTGEKPYKCPEEGCDKAFKTSGDLQKHVRTHTGERPFKCPFEGCDRSFTTSNIRKVHIRTHTGERPYICSEEGCGRAFASATNYKNHIRIHTGEKPYVCTVQGCGKRFTEYSSLYKHHVVHTHSKPYVCNYCGKTYRQTSTLAMHKRTTHGDDSPQDADPQLFTEQPDGDDESEEPAEKRAKFQYALASAAFPEGDSTLVINTSDAQQVTMVADNVLGTDEQAVSTITPPSQQTQITLEQLQQQHGVATLTVGENGQQVYVITDPAQLEALQQLAQQQQQLEAPETIDANSLINTEDSSCDTNIENSVGSVITSSVDTGTIVFNEEQ